jgi:hypothetical protein
MPMAETFASKAYWVAGQRSGLQCLAPPNSSLPSLISHEPTVIKNPNRHRAFLRSPTA